MTRESSLWTAFRDALPAGTHAVRVENCTELGTPDVNLCFRGHGGKNGREYWIELKVQDAPKRAKTVFSCRHFTNDQRQWLVTRTCAGGRAYMLLQVGRMYLWLRGDVAAVWVGFCTFTELCNRAEWKGMSLDDLGERLME